MRWLKMMLKCFALLSAVLLLVRPALSLRAQDDTGVSTIAFIAEDNQTDNLTLNFTDPQGAKVIPFVSNPKLFNPVFSPDGRQIAFSANPHFYSGYAVFVVNVDGSNLRKIDAHLVDSPMAAVWSPDSTQLIYGVFTGGGLNSEFYRVNADGTDEEPIKFDGIPDPIMETWIALSPDGSQIAVHANLDSDSVFGQLYVANADGSDAKPFPAKTADGHSYAHLAWSPDGKQVLLYTQPDMSNLTGSMAVADADGSNVKTIVKSPPINISSASWSPDGKQIVFIAGEPEFKAPGQLWIVDADGSNLHALKKIKDNVLPSFGASWGLIPKDLALPGEEISLDKPK